MSEPTTAAGRALWLRIMDAEAILAIETEADAKGYQRGEIAGYNVAYAAALDEARAAVHRTITAWMAEGPDPGPLDALIDAAIDALREDAG